MSQKQINILKLVLHVASLFTVSGCQILYINVM